MKRLLLSLFTLSLFMTACSNDDNAIKLTDGTKDELVFFADEQIGSINFNAQGPWKLYVVKYVTPSKPSDTPWHPDYSEWIQNVYGEGEAGSHTFKFYPDINYTGEDRIAYIELSCEQELTVIKITQKATDSKGEIPIPPTGAVKVDINVNTYVNFFEVRSGDDYLNTKNYSFIIDDGKNSRTIKYPTNDLIEGLQFGNYYITATSNPDKDIIPAFNKPIYESTQSINIYDTETRNISFECTQSNAGICFKYDPSIDEAGLGDIIPIITQDGRSLYYEGENRNDIGYFEPGEVIFRFMVNGAYEKINGEDFQTLDLKARQLWQIHLSYSSGNDLEQQRIMCEVKQL